MHLMGNFGTFEKDSVAEYAECDVSQSIGLVEVVQSKLDRKGDRKLRLGLDSDCTVRIEAADPKGFHQGLLFGD